MTFDTHELAWAAGFWDGEGNFNFVRYKIPVNWSKINRQLGQIRARLCQANTIPLKILQEALHVGKIYGLYKNAGQARFRIWEYSVGSFEETQAVIAMLWKWLSEPILLNARGL